MVRLIIENLEAAVKLFQNDESAHLMQESQI